ncbi:acetamidase/formamidase family protein [Siccirubricoccus sp. KC 17139]|uniref:Acetamidase/formamidase family protein n=1 Tax=Siccirubricoccus soli TaxID=2899147 RepID=A0ABT1D6R0_9PROT|nr:acetamidase/formamidase family protein [Siccirubricoccus soli]MCP2683407.1 acetamidase/formamidase family protein [Siccirubricoccus soli]
MIEIDSGDTVAMACVPAGGTPSLPADRSQVPELYRQAIETLKQGPGAHFVTGPVFVRGASRGDTLQVDILEATRNMDGGFTTILPLLGTLPEEFTDYETIHPRIDRERGACVLPLGAELPLAPLFGVIDIAPPPEWGACSTNIPRAFGGNMENMELKPGTTLYLPVSTEGAFVLRRRRPWRAGRWRGLHQRAGDRPRRPLPADGTQGPTAKMPPPRPQRT